MRRAFRHLTLGLALVGAVMAATDAPVRASASPAPQRHIERLDAKLRAVVGSSSSRSQRVIIRVRPGSRPALRDSLVGHGNQVLGEHESIDGLTAVVRDQDLATLAESDAVLSISSDAIVRPHGQLGGLLGIVGGLLNTVVNVVGDVLLPNGADTSGP